MRGRHAVSQCVRANERASRVGAITFTRSAVIILGILVQAADALAGPDGELARRRFRRAGDEAFSEGKAEF